MRKLSKPIFLLAMLVMFFGCQKPQQAPSESAKPADTAAAPAEAPKTTEGQKVKENKDITIGLALPTQREEHWVHARAIFEEYAKQVGVNLVVQVSDVDAAAQAKQVEALITQGVDIIILAPVDGGSAGTLADKAAAEGIPVLSYDRLILNTKNLAGFIAVDNKRVGELQGEFITKLVPKGNYIVLGGAPTDNNAVYFKSGAMEFIQPLADKGDIKIITNQDAVDWLPDNARKIVENALTTANNDIQAILSPNDGLAGGAVAALTPQGLAGKIPITGLDSEFSALKRIKEGTQSMTVFKDDNVIVKSAIDTALKVVKGEPINANGAFNNNLMDVPSVLGEPEVIQQSNLADYVKKMHDYGILTDAQAKELE